ncbi:MAG: hypothetical protein ACOX5Z_09485 [Desulfobulbus sp.]|jgi:hypothetical protein
MRPWLIACVVAGVLVVAPCWAGTKVSLNVGKLCREQAAGRGKDSARIEQLCRAQQRKAADKLAGLKEVPHNVFEPCLKAVMDSGRESYVDLLQCIERDWRRQQENSAVLREFDRDRK